MPPEALPEAESLRALLPVSRETVDRLARLVGLVRKWQKAENLVAPSTLGEIWTRHVADSAQLVALFPAARRWLDLGSGGGFPGLVIAILVVPLMVPTLIFGVAAADPANPGSGQALTILAALTLAGAAVGCLGAAAALRGGD